MTGDGRFDEAVSRWLEETAPARLPGRVLDATFERTGRSRQHRGWRVLSGRSHVPRLAPALASAAVVVVAAAVALNLYVSQPGPGGPPRLPTTPGDWERSVIELPSGSIGRVVSLAAGPRGLLAVVGEEVPYGDEYLDETQLAISTDGRHWTLVPDGQHPTLSSPRSLGYPSVVGTDRGFMLLQLGEIWTSEDGYDWRRLASASTDPDLRRSGPGAATAGGPGLVGVGGDKAWYSTDGSDWELATVPPLPARIQERPDSQRYVALTGVTAAGGNLVAWGIAEVPVADSSDEHLVVPLVWASSDGRTWVDVVVPQMDAVSSVAGGPAGFVAVGQVGAEPAAWLSADGRAWQRIAGDAFDSRWPTGPDGLRINNDPGDIPVELRLASATAGSAGYVVVGGDGLCVTEGFCSSNETAIWTSADGRSWSRVAGDDRFAGGKATAAVMWGSRFVVGGEHNHGPAIWISSSAP